MKARLLAVPLVLVGAAALAHIEFVVKGVHFKTSPIDFGQPPLRRTFGFADETGGGGGDWRPGTKYHAGFYEEDEAREARDERDRKRLLKTAGDAEQSGRLDDAGKAYRELKARGLGDPSSLAGRLELFATPGIEGDKGLEAYLRATNPLTKGPLPTDVGPRLAPWVAYAAARTPADYAAVARGYPASSRAEAALVMAARGEANVPKPTVTGLARARAAAETLLSRHPRSRFAWDAEGVLGRLDFLKGRLGAARLRYERQARTADTPARKARAHESLIACLRLQKDRAGIAFEELRWASAVDAADPYVARSLLYRTMGGFIGPDARRFNGLLTEDPPAFAAYLEFRQSLQPNAPDVLALADAACRATAGTPSRPRVDAILAQVALARNDPRARTFALGAQKGTDDDRAAGTFVLATLDRRAGRLAEARTGYATILKDHPKSYLVGGARENLALVSERLGDLATAMDGYRDLGYTEDVAYLSDARMTVPQLAAYVADHPKADGLRFTLAMRHLRKGEWDAAEKTLKPFSDDRRRQLTTGFVSPYAIELDGKLQDPLVTLRDLRKLDGDVREAQGEAKAEALAAMGDYYTTHKCLLLYSGPAWRGQRDTSFSFSWNPAVASPADDAALRAHYDEHECYAQALARYRRVLREFPKSGAAPHAAYWAAVDLKRLSNMAPYWRWRDRTADMKAEAIRLMALAAKSDDPELAAKAAKYGRVFADERREFRKAFADEKPPARRWDPAQG